MDVMGHRDEFFRPLTQLEALNVEMDLMAKDHWHCSADMSLEERQMNISGEPWTLYIHNQKVTKNI